MKCEDVRLQLAAYRRSEWQVDEQRSVRQHLSECAECRKWEMESRRVGERLRELPTITPPADFRARVFAAIQADQLVQSKASSTESDDLAQEISQPVQLYASAARSRHSHDQPEPVFADASANHQHIQHSRSQPIWFGKVTAIGTVAALFVMMLAIRFAPLLTTSTPPVSPLCAIPDHCTLHPFRITAPAQYPAVSSAIANGNSVFFAAQSGQGQTMVFYHNLNSPTNMPISSLPTDDTITFESLTDNMLVWLDTKPDKSWSLNATLLSSQPIKLLADSKITIISQGQLLQNQHVGSLQSLWINGQQGVFTFTTTQGSMQLEYFDASSGVPVYAFVAQAFPWHSIVDPYLDGQTIYWVDKSVESGDTLQGVIWRQIPDQQPAPLNLPGSVFGPIASGSQAAWFQSDATSSLSNGVGGSLAALGGIVMSRDSDAGQPNQISQGTVDATTLQRGTGYMLWRAGTGIYIYHIGGTNSVFYDRLLPDATTPLALTSHNITWVEHNTGGLTSSSDTIYTIDVP